MLRGAHHGILPAAVVSLTVAGDTCADCGARDVRVHLTNTPLCDRCADRRVARLTGLPELGAPPAPFVLTGPDGKRHRMQPRPWRVPTAIVVELEEVDAPTGEGFEFSILGAHHAEVPELLSQLRAHAEAEVSRQYLEPDPYGPGWRLAGDEAIDPFGVFTLAASSAASAMSDLVTFMVALGLNASTPRAQNSQALRPEGRARGA